MSSSEEDEYDQEEGASDDDFDPQEMLIAQEIMQEQAAENGADEEEEKKFTYNREGMEACLAQIALPEDFHWVETLSLTTPEPITLENAQDDIKRESLFYESSVAAVKEALSRFEEQKIPYLRPADYYAEMVKPDSHMARVKDVLLREQKKMAFVEQRKKAKASKALQREIQDTKRDERNKSKRDAVENLERVKKNARANNREMRAPRTEFEKSDSKPSNSQKTKRNADKRERNVGQGPSRKRKAADERFGFGGKKKHAKSNTAESVDEGKFSGKKNRQGQIRDANAFQSKRDSRKGSNKGGAKRPGKSKRGKR